MPPNWLTDTYGFKVRYTLLLCRSTMISETQWLRRQDSTHSKLRVDEFKWSVSDASWTEDSVVRKRKIPALVGNQTPVIWSLYWQLFLLMGNLAFFIVSWVTHSRFEPSARGPKKCQLYTAQYPRYYE